MEKQLPNYKKILVVEDNNAILDVITLALQSESYKVTGLTRGKHIIANIEQHKPDLLILDIVLPDGDGRELLKEIRTNESTAILPVLMISAKYTAQNISYGEYRPNCFVEKPFDIDDLLEKIDGILVRKAD